MKINHQIIEDSLLPLLSVYEVNCLDRKNYHCLEIKNDSFRILVQYMLDGKRFQINAIDFYSSECYMHEFVCMPNENQIWEWHDNVKNLEISMIVNAIVGHEVFLYQPV